MNYARIENGVCNTNLPTTGTLKNGSTVSGYDKLSKSQLLNEGWKELEEIKPEVLENQHLEFSCYEELEDKIVAKYVVVDNPPPQYPSKQDKISLLSRECGERIINGIDFTWDGETKHYSLDITDQMKINTLYLKCLNGQLITSWHADGEDCIPWNADKFISFAEQAMYFVTYSQVRFNSGIRPLVESMEDLAEINAVTLDTELSAEVEARIMELVSITLTGQ